LSGNPSFRELLARVRETAMGAYAHQDVPFEKLVEELHPDRDLGRNPLFQVMLILQNVPTAGQKFADLELEAFPLRNSNSKFDLTLIAAEREDGLRATFEYNTDLFDAATIERVAENFHVLLKAAVSDATQPIAALPILTKVERQQLVCDWNATASDYRREACVHELFAQRAMQYAGKAAVIFGKDEITYKELNARANQLAHYLRARGAGPEVLIGIFVDRSMDMLVALLGVLKSGAAYVPLDPAYPMERIGFILQDAKAPILLTQNHLVPALPAHSAEVIRLDADWGRIAKESSDDLPRTALPSNIAYVLYTSGSTGKPEGVQVEHRNLTNFLESMRNKPGISSGDVLLALTTLSFDIAGLELYLPLVEGATVVLASREQCVDAKQLIGLLSQSGATMMQATPATWRMLIEAGWSGNPGLKVLCGG